MPVEIERGVSWTFAFSQVFGRKAEHGSEGSGDHVDRCLVLLLISAHPLTEVTSGQQWAHMNPDRGGPGLAVVRRRGGGRLCARTNTHPPVTASNTTCPGLGWVKQKTRWGKLSKRHGSTKGGASLKWVPLAKARKNAGSWREWNAWKYGWRPEDGNKGKRRHRL